MRQRETDRWLARALRLCGRQRERPTDGSVRGSALLDKKVVDHLRQRLGRVAVRVDVHLGVRLRAATALLVERVEPRARRQVEVAVDLGLERRPERARVLGLVRFGDAGHGLAVEAAEEAREQVLVVEPARHRVVQPHREKVGLAEEQRAQRIVQPVAALAFERLAQALVVRLLVLVGEGDVLGGRVLADRVDDQRLLKVLKPSLLALSVERGRLLRRHIRVGLARLVAVAHVQGAEQRLEVAVRAAELAGEEVDERLVRAPLPHHLALLQLRLRACHEDLEQRRLVAAQLEHARVACEVDDVRHVLGARGEGKVHEALVAAARLALHLRAHVLVVHVAVLLARALQLRLGASAHGSDQLVVVAAEAHEAAVHRFVDGLAVVERNVLLDPTVVRLETGGAIGHDLGVVCRLVTCLEDGRQECSVARLGLDRGFLVDGEVDASPAIRARRSVSER